MIVSHLDIEVAAAVVVVVAAAVVVVAAAAASFPSKASEILNQARPSIIALWKQ